MFNYFEGSIVDCLKESVNWLVEGAIEANQWLQDHDPVQFPCAGAMHPNACDTD